MIFLVMWFFFYYYVLDGVDLVVWYGFWVLFFVNDYVVLEICVNFSLIGVGWLKIEMVILMWLDILLIFLIIFEKFLKGLLVIFIFLFMLNWIRLCGVIFVLFLFEWFRMVFILLLCIGIGLFCVLRNLVI